MQIEENNNEEIITRKFEENKEKGQYFEDIMLMGFVIGYAKISLDEKLEKIKWFILKIDSWMVCDSFIATLKFKEKDLQKVWKFILPYIKSDKEFEIRFAVVTMIGDFVTEQYIDDVINILDNIKNEGYYVKMAIAWCMAEIGIKFNNKFMKYIKTSNLNKWTYNKTLQKLIESNRTSKEEKDLYRSMKR